MQRVFTAEFAVFHHFNTIRIVFLVFVGLIVTLFAFSTCQSYCITHPDTPHFNLLVVAQKDNMLI